MNIPFLCIFFAFLLNYASRMPVVFAMQAAGYDNEQPRDQQRNLTGWGGRAVGAHLNSFEIFPAFAVAVILAYLANVDLSTQTVLAVSFIILRIIYLYLYLANYSTLRTLVWVLGVLCVVGLYVAALF